MPGSSQISGPVAYDGNDLRFVAENDSVSLVRSKANWYIARDEIEERSPSRKDGIDSAKEHELRKSYCSFLRDFGIKLRMPHVVIATSTVFCHRFYLHQSHHKNDRYTIATACMFLAGKVEEARRALEEVVLLSYCLQNKNNPIAAEEFKEKEICERQKELVLLAEQVVLVTLDFNLKVRHPYSFILLATSKYKSASDTLFRVSCIILNDALYTTLCLQFKPQHIAASALLLAAKLLKFKFPSKGWWKEFNVKLCQLEEICSQILELYEQERAPFSIVQSSSSSSSVDDKAKVLSESIAAGDLVRCGLPQPHLMDNSAASLSSIRLTKSNRSGLPGSAGHPSSTSLPATGQKLGFKVSPKILPNSSKLKSSDSETPAKRKRPDDDNGTGNLQQLSRHKQSVIPRKGK